MKEWERLAIKDMLMQERKETAEKFADFIKRKLFELGNVVNESDVDDMLEDFSNEN